MRTFYSVLVSTLLITNFLSASENISAEPNGDNSKRRAVTTRSIARSATPRSPLAPLNVATTNSHNNSFNEADNSRYRQNPLVPVAPVAPVAMTQAIAIQHTEHNRDWENTQLPTVHRLAKDIIVDFLLLNDPSVSVDERYQRILGAHNLFLTCKHWAEFTLNCNAQKWIPIWHPVTGLNDHVKRIVRIHEALPLLLAEITGFNQSTAKDRTAKTSTPLLLYKSYTDAQVGRMLANFRTQYKDGKRVYFLGDYHDSTRTKGTAYWINVRKIETHLTSTTQNRRLQGLSINASLKFLPHNLWDLGTRLSSLDVSKNNLSEIPKSLGNLAALETLDLSRNANLAQLPKAIVSMTSLRNLSLSHTGEWVDIELPASLLNLSFEEAHLSKLESLKAEGLNYLNVKNISPPSLQRLLSNLPALTNLQGLVLTHTAIDALTRDLAECTSLKSIALRDKHANDFAQHSFLKAGMLPTSIINLDLQGYRGADVIASIAPLRNLEILNLFGRGANATPLSPHIANFRNLKVLAINTSVYAPSMFGSLPDLDFLILGPSASATAQAGLDHFPHYFRHYGEIFCAELKGEPVGLSILSRRAYPWTDDVSKELLSQIKLPKWLFEAKEMRRKERQGQVWGNRWAQTKITAVLVSALMGDALTPIPFRDKDYESF